MGGSKLLKLLSYAGQLTNVQGARHALGRKDCDPVRFRQTIGRIIDGREQQRTRESSLTTEYLERH